MTYYYHISGGKWKIVVEKGGLIPWSFDPGAVVRRHRSRKKATMMFMGEYSHTVDTKGRLIIPAKFRDLLGEEFIVTKGLDGCLNVFPQSEWGALEQKLRTLPLTNKGARQLTRFYVAGATPCELDKQGRILLPATLREFAGLEKDVVLAGMLNRVEIWSKDRWAENNAADDMDHIAEQMTDLGLMI